MLYYIYSEIFIKYNYKKTLHVRTFKNNTLKKRIKKRNLVEKKTQKVQNFNNRTPFRKPSKSVRKQL